MDSPAEFELPFPPSINHYFNYYQGRPILSQEAKTFRKQVRRITLTKAIKPILGILAIRIDITPPDHRRRDSDNVQKSVIDALQQAGLFWDDAQVVWLLSVKHEPQPPGKIRVQLADAATSSLSSSREVS